MLKVFVINAWFDLGQPEFSLWTGYIIGIQYSVNKQQQLPSKPLKNLLRINGQYKRDFGEEIVLEGE